MLDEDEQASLINRFSDGDLSVAMSQELSNELSAHFRVHLEAGKRQEDLAFALWSPSYGETRTSAILDRIIWPEDGDRLLRGNVSFTAEYVQRVLKESAGEYGIALIHSHLGPGWQDMSRDDVVAERDRLAGAVFGRTILPLLGLTWGIDESWSARFWIRQAPSIFARQDAGTVRVVGRRLGMTFHPTLRPAPKTRSSQVATVSVWGPEAQATLARLHVGIVGLGSVGSIVAESLSRIGVSRVTLIDHDVLETRNLDRTLGAVPKDVDAALSKVDIAKRGIESSHTAENVTITACNQSLESEEGYARALSCDVLFSCVDHPAPRSYLNAISYSHLIPVVDGGIRAEVRKTGELLHVTWRIHTIGPERACLVCLGRLTRSEISVGRSGQLENPVYIQGLEEPDQFVAPRQNVFPFSLSVAAHEVLQMVGLVTGSERIGGYGPQTYHGYPGKMEVDPVTYCQPDCEYGSLTATAVRVIPES